MRRAPRQAPSEIADRKFEKSIDFLASVGMLAKKAEQFRSREDGDGGSSGAPEPSSERKRRASLRLEAVTSASGGRRRARDERAPSSHAASVGHGTFEDLDRARSARPCPAQASRAA
jgi:hypothetical protein